MDTIFRIHRFWGYVSIVANGLAGLYCLAAWKWKGMRGRPVWIVTTIAEVAILIQLILGVALVAGDKAYAKSVPRFHLFYAVLIFITVGLLYAYRRDMRGRLELMYGLGGLFVMGLGIRAVLQVVA